MVHQDLRDNASLLTNMRRYRAYVEVPQRKLRSGTMTTPTKLLTEHEAAERLAVSVRTLRRWRWLKAGPSYTKIGACVRYGSETLDAFVEAGRIATDAHKAAA